MSGDKSYKKKVLSIQISPTAVLENLLDLPCHLLGVKSKALRGECRLKINSVEQ